MAGGRPLEHRDLLEALYAMEIGDCLQWSLNEFSSHHGFRAWLHERFKPDAGKFRSFKERDLVFIVKVRE